MMSNADKVQTAIDSLIEKIRENMDPSEEIGALKQLVAQLQVANENLVLATVKAQTLQEEADLRNRQQNQFLAMLAHELRNPMAPISNAAQLLEKITVAHPLLDTVQEIIQRQVSHMARLLDDLLDASRINSGKVTLQKKSISLGEVLTQAVEVCRPFLEKRRQRLNIDVNNADVSIDADLLRLSQVFSNLLINASKFTQEEGQITLCAEVSGDAVKVSVQDNGKGIEPELQPHIFDLFVQGPRELDRSEGGLGIGLAVAKGITEMHGGRITAKSEGLGTGALFEVSLPLATTPFFKEPADLPVLRKPSAGGCLILIVEDNADLVSTLCLRLELEGHQVMTATDGLAGLSLARQHPYDVLICDIGLPGLDGYEVITQIRQQKERAQPFAIAISGYGQPEDRTRALNAGFDHYMVKPVIGDKLLHLIASMPEARAF